MIRARSRRSGSSASRPSRTERPYKRLQRVPWLVSKGDAMEEFVELEFQDVPVAESEQSVLVHLFDSSVWGNDAREVWQALRGAGPIVRTTDDMVVATSTAAVEEVLRSPNLFSSNPEASYFGSETGAIPLQIDPPDHVRYRKILDPLFAPRKMAAREAEGAALT